MDMKKCIFMYALQEHKEIKQSDERNTYAFKLC